MFPIFSWAHPKTLHEELRSQVLGKIFHQQEPHRPNRRSPDSSMDANISEKPKKTHWNTISQRTGSWRFYFCETSFVIENNRWTGVQRNTLNWGGIRMNHSGSIENRPLEKRENSTKEKRLDSLQRQLYNAHNIIILL